MLMEIGTKLYLRETEINANLNLKVSLKHDR